MSGFITEGEIGNTLAESAGTDLIPSTPGEVRGAAFEQAWANSPGPRLARWIGARTPSTQPRTMQPDEANEMYGVEGRLSFTEPVTMDVARDLHDFHRGEVVREDILRRNPGNFGAGGVAQFGAAAAATILDPINIASAFVPFFGSARIAQAIGVTGASVAGRLAVRGLEGLGAGAVGAAAVEPLNLWLSAQDKDDYTMGDALASIALGAVAGSVLHNGLGLLRDWRRGIPDWTPRSHQAAMTQAVSAVAEGRPVRAAEAAEYAAAREAREELEAWYAKVREVDVRATQAETQYRGRIEAMTAAADDLDTLRQEAAQLAREVRAIETLRGGRNLHLPQRARLTEIDAKLADADTPLSERLAMEIERLDLIDEAAAGGRTSPRPGIGSRTRRGAGCRAVPRSRTVAVEGGARRGQAAQDAGSRAASE